MVQRTHEQSISFARETATIIDVIKRHFLELVTAREGTKEKVETLKENGYACSKAENITQFKF